MLAKHEHQSIRKKHFRWLLYSLAVGFAWTSLIVFEVVVFGVLIRGIPTPF